MRLSFIAGLIGFCFLQSGCETFTVSTYSSSAKNVSRMREFSQQRINIGEFNDKSNTTRVMCRSIPLLTPGQKTYAKFIRKALIAELIMANIYRKDADVILTATLDNISVSTIVSPSWSIDLSIKSSNGYSTKISNNYKFKAGFSADVGCRSAAQAFVPAVQKLISDLISSDEFEKLIAVKQPVESLK